MSALRMTLESRKSSDVSSSDVSRLRRIGRSLRLAGCLIVLAIPLSGCGTGALWDKFFAKDDTFVEEPADKLYNEGLYLMNQRKDLKAASKKFEEVDRKHPYSDWARQSLLMSAYSFYQAGDYDGDVAAVFAAARAYVEGRAGAVSKPALVLDIDETSLSNWANIKANNFGFIRDGACDRLPNGPCGFRAWILQGVAPVVKPALDLFNAAKAKGVAVFFITGRRDSERQATLWNLDRAGFEGWEKLVTRPDDDAHATVQAFKTEQRRKVADAGYAIIATVGDQQSDLDGGFAECTFKVPNPFYFIP